MSDLTLAQASSLATEITLAKNYATTAINISTSNTTDIQEMKINKNVLNTEITKLKHLEQMKAFGVNYGVAIDIGLQYFDENLPEGLGLTSRLSNLDVYPMHSKVDINRIGEGLVDPDFDGVITLSQYDATLGTTSLVTNPGQEQFLKVFKGTYDNNETYTFNPELKLGQLGLDVATSPTARFSIWYGGVWWFMGKVSVFHPVSVTSFVGDFTYKGKHYDGVAYGRAPCMHMNPFIGPTSLGLAGGDSWTAYISWTWYFKIIDGNMALSYMIQNSFWAEDTKYIAPSV